MYVKLFLINGLFRYDARAMDIALQTVVQEYAYSIHPILTAMTILQKSKPTHNTALCPSTQMALHSYFKEAYLNCM